MPPRKSDARKSDVSFAEPLEAATNAPANDTATEDSIKVGSTTTEKKDAVTIEDLNLPKSIITRLAKGALPPNTQIQGNALLAMSKSATVFINYLASYANENTMSANKKTIAPADVFKALDEIEFGFLKQPLEAEFAKFNAIQTEKRNSYRQKVKASKDTDTDMADTSIMAGATDKEDDDAAGTNTPPPAKKARVGTGLSAGAGGEDTEVDEDAEDDAIADEDEDEDEDDEDEDNAAEEEEEEEEEEDDDEASGDETQDALEDRARGDEPDEALDGEDSD